VGHTWKGVEALGDLRYAKAARARRRFSGKFKDDGKFDGQFKCNIKYARLNTQAAAAHSSNVHGWRSEDRRYKGNGDGTACAMRQCG